MLDVITPTLFTAESRVTMPGRVILPARMTVLDLGDGDLLIHSPLAFDDALEEAVRRRGTVRWIVAPNAHHHLYLRDAVERFPEATLLGAPGAMENEPDLHFDASLADGPSPEWTGRLEMLELQGTRHWDEFVFFAPDSRTLLCTDLVMNIHDIANLRTSLALWLLGLRKRFAQSRLERWYLVEDRARFGSSLQQLFEWDFDRIVMAHGRIVETGGRQKLMETASWVLPTNVKQLEGT